MHVKNIADNTYTFDAQCLSKVGKNMSFDYGLALKYGETEALLLSFFTYYTLYVKKEQKNFYKQRYWIPISVAKLLEHYPFLSHSKIRTALAKLEQQQVLCVDNFNNRPGDKTKWYSLNTQIHLIQKYLNIIAQRYNQKNKSKNTFPNVQVLGENDQVLSENHQPIGEINQGLSENHQDVSENSKAITNTSNINNNIYNTNMPTNLPLRKTITVRESYSTLL